MFVSVYHCEGDRNGVAHKRDGDRVPGDVWDGVDGGHPRAGETEDRQLAGFRFYYCIFNNNSKHGKIMENLRTKC